MQRAISIILRGNGDSCGDDDNDCGGIQNVSGGEMAMMTMRMVVVTTLAALMVSMIAATRMTTTMMKTTMMAATQQLNGTQIGGERTATGTKMMMISATMTVVATKAAALMDGND